MVTKSSPFFMLLALVLLAVCPGCTFDTSGVVTSQTDSVSSDLSLEGSIGDICHEGQLDRSLDARDLPRAEAGDGAADHPAPLDRATDLPPDAAVEQGVLPDMPLPDQTSPDFARPPPDLPPPDLPTPDLPPTPDLLPSDLPPPTDLPVAPPPPDAQLPPDAPPLPSCKTLFGGNDGYHLCWETATECRFYHSEGLFGGSYSCDKLCKPGKCLQADNTKSNSKCGTGSSTKCSTKHNAHTCSCSKL